MVVESLLSLLKRYIGSRREKKILDTAERIVFQSQWDRDSFAARFSTFPADNVRVIPNNGNASWMDTEYRDTNNSVGLNRLLYIGALNQRKGLPELLEAYRLLRRNGIKLQLDFIGFGDLEDEIRRQIDLSDWHDSVHLLGRIENPLPYLADSDLLIVPSLFDSYPNVILEAFHTGTPVIGSSTGGIPEIIGSDKYLFKAGNVETLAAAVEKLCDSESYSDARRWSKERREIFTFDWAGRFGALLDEVSAGKY